MRSGGLLSKPRSGTLDLTHPFSYANSHSPEHQPSCTFMNPGAFLSSRSRPLPHPHLIRHSYRLMLRRCLETANPRFGMIMPPRTADGSTDFGTMLEIRTVQMFPDGRSMVETWGVQCFRVLARGTLDGYAEMCG
jgi:hypothetical protein